jgi:TP901 family phage tail tape measure protein
MAARTVSVKLTAEVASYITGMKNAAAATKDFGSQVARDAKANRAAWNEVGVGMLAVGAAVGAGVAIAVKKFSDFDAQMSSVRAATHQTATGMDMLRKAALEAGARTAFSAVEAAKGIEALAKAGVSTRDILRGGLAGALDLAAAGGLEVGAAAEIAATALTQFRLSGSQVPHVADLLAAAAGKAQGDVSDMGMALKQAGLVASQTGLTIEETTAGLAAFASAGLLGSDAGTSFKAMLQRLTPQSVEAADLMDRLGISAYDAQGNFIGLEAFAGNLQQSLSGLTVEQRNSAMATIFGSDAVRAASVLYQQGSAGIAEWTEKVDDTGYASETAAIRLDNLRGDLEALGGSIETALIGAGSGANTVLRELTQAATGAVNVFNALPAPVQQSATVVGAVTSAVALAGGAFFVAVPKVVAYRDALANMGPSAQRFGGAISSIGAALTGPIGGALAAGTVALGVYGAARGAAAARVQAFTDAVMRDSGVIGENTRALAAAELEQRGLLKTAERLGLNLETVGEAAIGNTKATNQLRGELKGLITEGQNATQRMSQLGGELQGNEEAAINTAGAAEELLTGVNRLTTETEGGIAAARRQAEALGAVEEQAGGTTQSQNELTGAVGGATVAIISQEEAAEELTESIRNLSDQVLGARASERDFEAALDDATAAVTENGRTLDITTDAGRKNSAALDGIAAAANDVAQSMVESGRPIEEVRARIEAQRGALFDAARQFGMTEDQARAYTDSVLRIPQARTTTVNAETGAATSRLDGLTARLDRLDGRVVTNFVRTNFQEFGANRSTRFADGGWVGGRGGPREDNQLIAASPGEFVVNARSAAQNALLLEAINAGRAFASGGWVSGRMSITGPTSGGSQRQVDMTNYITVADGADIDRLVRRLEFDVESSSL